MNDNLASFRLSQHPDDGNGELGAGGGRPGVQVPVGDVYVRPDEGGFGIFNYRGERVLESSVTSRAEAAKLAHDIVSPWRGQVILDDSSQDQ